MIIPLIYKVKFNYYVSGYFKNNKIYLAMARPIKETPILFGSDARRFEERMQNPPKVSPEERANIRKSYDAVIKMMVN